MIKSGHIKPAHGESIIAGLTAKLDRHAAAKRSMAAKASVMKAPRGGLGSLGGSALPPEQGTLLSPGNQSDVPGGSGVGTTKDPFDQGNQSGGVSQVPNTSFSRGGKRGPGY
jgi:hypothetical protein